LQKIVQPNSPYNSFLTLTFAKESFDGLVLVMPSDIADFRMRMFKESERGYGHSVVSVYNTLKNILY
jgi:hypothetical protein